MKKKHTNVPYSKGRKLLFVMQLTILLSLAALMRVSGGVYSQPAFGQSTLLVLNVENASVESIIQEIKKQSGLSFLYRADLLHGLPTMSLKVKKAKVEEVLDQILKPNGLAYEIYDSTVILRRQSPSQKSSKDTDLQEFAVSGRVTSQETGEGLPGVNVLVRGTKTGTVTDIEGNYNIKVGSESDTLVFSSVGYMTQEVAVNGKSNISVTLIEDITSLGEVVVTALGITREKAALPYAVSELSGEGFTKAREINLGNALSGKVAGVNATSTSTGPGGSSRVIIRGNGSLGGNNQPLYVINGVPIDNSNLGSAGMWGGYDAGDGLSSINPDDIENISVLKGGTAAALYGSRAANGVILITTKAGKAQKGIGVEFNSTYTMETPLVFSDFQDQYGSGNRGVKPTTQEEAIASGTVSWGAPLDGSMVIQPDGIARPYTAQGNNIKKFYNVGNTISNTLALNGGNESVNFRFSASNMGNDGIIPNSSIKRKTFNLSVNANLAEKVVFESTVQYNIENGINRPYVSDQPRNVNSAPQLLAPNIDIRTLAPGYDDRGYEGRWHIGDANNPYFIINKVKNNDERRRLLGAFSTRYNIKDYLYVRGRFGIDYYNVKAENITPTGIQYWTPNMNTNNRTTYESNVEGLVGFNKSFGRFSVAVIAGGNQMHNVVDALNLSSGEFNVPFQYFITNGTSQQFSQVFQEYAINSLFASTDIGFRDYLYLSLSGRKDWFSTLPSNNNNLFYPSAGLSFVFSDAWESKPSWLSYGKIRASWAQVGGGAPDPYSLNLVYTTAPSPHLGQPLLGIEGGAIPNSSIKPYTSTTTEFGIELKGLNNRVGADITFYNRVTTDDIVSASVPSSSGYQNVLLNVGEVQNRGIEILLTGSPIRSNNGINWEVSYNMAYNKNTVVKIAEGLNTLMLPNGEVRTRNGFIYHYEGMPFGQIAGYKAKTDASGNIVYNRATGVPVKSDFMALGNGVPPINMGLTNSFNYNNFSFSFLLDGKFGGKLYSATNAYATQWGLSKRTVENNVRENGVSVSGVDTEGQPFNATVDAQTYFQGIALTISDEFVYDASFVKLRQLTFGYSFPYSILSKTPFQSANLSIVARNLLLLYSKVPNVDPESTYNNSNAQGLEMYGVPPTRSFGLNLLVRF